LFKPFFIDNYSNNNLNDRETLNDCVFNTYNILDPSYQKFALKNASEENIYKKQNRAENNIFEKKENIELQYEENNKILKQIFLDSSSFNKIKNEYLLPYSKFLKIIFLKNTKEKNLIFRNNELENEILHLNDIDLIIFNHFKKKKQFFSFNEFSDLLRKVCERIYSNYEESPKEFLIKFIKEYLIGQKFNDSFTININFKKKNSFNIDMREDAISSDLIYNKNIFDATERNKVLYLENFICNFKLDIKIKIILISILETLVKLYKSYFYFEVNNFTDKHKIEHNSYDTLIKFCINFDLIPIVFSKELISNYWNLILKSEKINEALICNKDFDDFNLFIIHDTQDPDLMNYNATSKSLQPSNLGVVFTFFKFCVFLIHLSELADEKIRCFYEKYFHKIVDINKTNNIIDPNLESNKSERFLFLLEKLNRSKGFINFEKNLSLAYNTKFSLLPSIKVINLILPSLIYLKMKEDQKAKNIQELKKNRFSYQNLNKKMSRLETKNCIINNSELFKKSNRIINYSENKYKNKHIYSSLDNINYEIYEKDLSILMPIEGHLIKKLNLKLTDLKEIFDYYSSQLNIDGLSNKPNKMIFISFHKFLEDNLLIAKKEKNFIDKGNEISNDLNSTFNKTPRYLKEYKLIGQDAINIFSELVSMKNINNTGTTKNIITEASSKKDSETKKEKDLKLKQDFKYSTIDFFLFIKSFEYLSLKIFWNKNMMDGLCQDSNDNADLLNKAMEKFINYKIPSFITNFNIKKFYIKKNLEKQDIKQNCSKFIMQDNIVIKFNGLI